MTTHKEVIEAIETIIYEYIHEQNAVRSVREINNGHCRQFVEDVLEYLSDPDDVIRHDADTVHSWIELDYTFYDAEVPEGVDHPNHLPVFERTSRRDRAIAEENHHLLNF